MAGIKALRKLQFYREVTAGTTAAATTIWRGMGTIEDQRELMYPDEDVGIHGKINRSYIPKIGAALSLDSVEATFEQFPHILEMGVKTVTPAQDGSGSGYVYAYTLPTTAAPTVKTYTIQGGDNQQAEYMEYCHVADFSLEGNAGEAWMMSANLVGRQVRNGAFTAGVSIPSVEEMLFQKTSIYVDNVAGSFGGTLFSNTLVQASLDYNTGIIPKFIADGNLYFSFIQYTAPEVVLNVTLEHDSNAVTEKTNWRNETPRLIRLLCQGSAFTTAGSAYTNKTMIIDLAGKWTSFDKIGERDGNDIIEATFTARYDTTKGEMGTITVVNALSALP